MKRAKWSRPWLFGWLGIFVAFTAYELYAVFGGNAATPPLTEVIHRYVNPNWFFAGLGALGLWLVFHFINEYRKRKP